MNVIEIKTNDFQRYIKDAISRLKDFDYEEAFKAIMNAFNENPNLPEPHNLLGLYYEFKENFDLARKHYRIAYVLNPTYKPASENLERVSTLFLHKSIPVNYGEEITEELTMAKRNNKEVNAKMNS